MFIKEAPSFHGLKTASVDGHHFTDAKKGIEFLTEAEIEAKQQGYENLIGPMANGSWGAYRLVLSSDGSPSFKGEPQSGIYDLQAYLQVGFKIGELHSSAKVNLADMVEPRRRLSDFEVKNWNGKNPEQLLTGVYKIIMTAFAKAPFFTPLPVEQFIAAYMPLLNHVDPQLLLCGYNSSDAMIGFLLAYPDANWPQGLIVKTYAALVPGAGRYMFDLVHWKGRLLGYKTAVHGLMRDGNYSTAASRRVNAKIFRRYALMEKRL